MSARLTYLNMGVSSSKEDVEKAISDINPGLFKNSFCKIVPDIFIDDKKSCLIIHSDGAGTKSILAYLFFKQINDIKYFKGIAQDSIVMNLDDLLCIGAINNFLLSNTIGRNRNYISGDIISEIIEGYEDFINLMNKYGISIISGGGETADIGDSVRNIVVDSTLVTRMKRNDVIDAKNISPGNDIIGLASYGKAVYETSFNSGIGSNGFTLARHALLSTKYKGYSETFDEALNPKLVYQGPFDIEDKLPGLSMTVGEALLSPTRTYAPIIKEILKYYGKEINAIVHCTGGGQTKCLKFGNNIKYIKNNMFPLQPIFRIIQEMGKIEWQEMYRTFNMGHRMELFINPDISNEIIKISNKFGVDAKIIGKCEKSISGNELEIISDLGEFIYGAK